MDQKCRVRFSQRSTIQQQMDVVAWPGGLTEHPPLLSAPLEQHSSSSSSRPFGQFWARMLETGRRTTTEQRRPGNREDLSAISLYRSTYSSRSSSAGCRGTADRCSQWVFSASSGGNCVQGSLRPEKTTANEQLVQRRVSTALKDFCGEARTIMPATFRRYIIIIGEAGQRKWRSPSI